MKTSSLFHQIIESPRLYNHLSLSIGGLENLAEKNGYTVALGVVDSVRNREEKSYVVSKSLLDALISVDCEEVGPWHLKGKQAYHFLLSKDSLSDSATNYREMFVTIMPPREIIGLHQNASDSYKLCVFMVSEMKEGQAASIYIGARYDEGSTIAEIVDSASKDIGNMALEKGIAEKAVKLALNLLLYINSPDPSIMILKPQVYNLRSFRNDYFNGGGNMFGIYSLGWDFHGREYSISMGTRKGHFRWQPCGPMWCNRKLIFVATTTVTYKKDS